MVSNICLLFVNSRVLWYCIPLHHIFNCSCNRLSMLTIVLEYKFEWCLDRQEKHTEIACTSTLVSQKLGEEVLVSDKYPSNKIIGWVVDLPIGSWNRVRLSTLLSAPTKQIPSVASVVIVLHNNLIDSTLLTSRSTTLLLNDDDDSLLPGVYVIASDEKLFGTALCSLMLYGPLGCW